MRWWRRKPIPLILRIAIRLFLRRDWSSLRHRVGPSGRPPISLHAPDTREGAAQLLPPSMPIMIGNSFDSPTPHSTLSLEDGNQVIAAFEQRDRVRRIHLQDILSALLENLATAMQKTSSDFGRPMRLRLCLSSPSDSRRGESHFLNYPSFFCPRMISSILYCRRHCI